MRILFLGEYTEKAKELGCKSFTTSLLISPKKSQDKLQIIGDKLAEQYNLNFIFKDYRAGNGVEMQGKAVKENSLCIVIIPKLGNENVIVDLLKTACSTYYTI